MDIVLVHGLAGSARWWAPLVPALQERHVVHALDLPRLRPRRDPADRIAHRIAGLERPVLVGHSLGGLVCVTAAASAPELVRAVALIAPIGVPLGRSVVALGPALVAALRLGGLRFVPRLGLDAVRAGPLSLLVGARRALIADVEADLAQVGVSVLLVWGERDPIVRSELAERWLAVLPNARLVTLAGAAHVPMLERPRELAAALLDFLDEVERQPA